MPLESHAYWGYRDDFRHANINTVIASGFGATAIAVVMVVTGLLMLAYVVRGVPKEPAIGADGDVVLVATKSKKKGKGKAK